MNILKSWIKSKTMIFSFLLTVFSVVELNMQLFHTMLGDWYPIILILVSIIVAWLRTVTTTSLENK